MVKIRRISSGKHLISMHTKHFHFFVVPVAGVYKLCRNGVSTSIGNLYIHDEKTSFPDISRNYTPEGLIKVLKKDDIYFRMIGGGIVFGGGEPLFQATFIHEVCRLADPAWKKRIETSLYGDWRSFRVLVDDIDEWIIDIKDMNPDIYKKYTQASNCVVIRNLKMLRKKSPPQTDLDTPSTYSRV